MERRMLYRLLMMYPVKVIKDFFQLKGMHQQEALRKVLDDFDDSVIYNFAYEKFNYTKQHVYLYNANNVDLSKLSESILSSDDVYKKSSIPDGASYFYFFRTPYRVYLTNPLAEEEILFYWPIRIDITSKLIKIHFTKLEKNIKSYIDNIGTRQIVKSDKKVSEKDIVIEIMACLSECCEYNICDLNRGIKRLWSDDEIDASRINYRKSKSSSVEAMDEDFTLKEQYPELCADIMRSPINKTVFRFKNEDDRHYDHIVVDPTNGFIGFPTYPKSGENIENVLQKIIEFN